MSAVPLPLVTLPVHEALCAARRAGAAVVSCSLDLGRSSSEVRPGEAAWRVGAHEFPYLEDCRERTVYHWTGARFEPVARYAGALIKLVPTEWGPPTFEIDGIKMLPSARLSPWDDADRKVALIEPRGKTILDTCGGLGYFAAWCARGGAARVLSFEKNAQVLWLRSLNPWSPEWLGGTGPPAALRLEHADVTARITALEAGSCDAILHDPPRFGIAGELYSRDFYAQLARVLRPRGRLFHYTGAPQKVARGRDLAREVTQRLRGCGFDCRTEGDGVLAIRSR